MSDRFEEIRRESGFSGNYIPLGRQLPRTPPLTDVTKHLDFCNADEDCENMEEFRDLDEENRTFDFSTPETKKEHASQPDDPNSMLRGMKGYQLIPSDLEFIKKMQQEKLLKKLQSDLEEVQKSLKKETMAAELVYASREKAQAELKKFPSCEELTDWVKVVLRVTSPSAELEDVDAKSLLAMVTKEDVQRVVDDKKIELARMEKMVANKRKKDIKEREKLERQITSEQVKIQGLMSQLSDLKSELAQQQDVCKSLEMQINTREAPEIKVEAETSEEQAVKGQVRQRGKERKKATNQTKSTRSKLTDGETSEKDDHANKSAGETVKTKPKSGAAATEKQTKAARGLQKKVEETESNPQESEQAVRGRRKPARAPQTSQPKNQSKVKTEEAASSRSRQKAGGDEAQGAGLRRSKRIASRT